MRDFPPHVADFDSPLTPGQDRPASGVRRGLRTRGASGRARRGVFADPDTRSPARFLRWLLAQQRPVLFVSAVTAVLEWLPGAFGPYLIGRIVDEGIVAGDLGRMGELALVLFGLVVVGVLAGVLNHTFVVRAWLIGMYGPMKMVNRKTLQLGHVLPQRTPTGEVLSVASGDTDEFGALTEIVSRAVGALAAYLVIAMLVLSTSFWLGVMVLVAAPMIVMLALPLLGPLQRREELERTRLAELTGMATDIVAGLRILRGIGGEQTFARNYADQSQRTRRAGVAAGVWQSAVDACSVLFSGLFLVVLTWLGAREVVAGRLSVGELISFFGYAVFMVWPIQTFFELAQRAVRSLVSAGKADGRVLRPAAVAYAVASARGCPTEATLHDERSGFTAEPGRLTMIVSALPDDSAALADRLGRYLPADHEPVSLEGADGLSGRQARRARARQQAELARVAEREQALAGQKWGVSLGSVDLADVPIAAVRERIVVSDSASQVFAGTLQEAIDPHGSAHPRPGRDRPARRRRRGRLHRSRRRLAGPARGAGPRPVRRPAPAGGAGPGAGPRAGHPGHGRADLGGRRPHRGADRRAAGRVPGRAGRPSSPPAHRCCCTTRTGWRSCPAALVTAYGTHEELLRTDRGYRAVVRPGTGRRRPEKEGT